MQETRARSLVGQDPTCRGASKPQYHPTEPTRQAAAARAPRQQRPAREGPARCSPEEPRSPQRGANHMATETQHGRNSIKSFQKVRQITTGLLPSPGNSQCYMTAWMAGGLGGEWIHVYLWLSPVVHLKLSQHCWQAVLQYKIKN